MGIGLVIGARGRTLEHASGWVSVLMLVQWVFSGVFFSRHVYPEAWQPWLSLLPLTALVDAVRGVMSHGDTFLHIVDALGILLA